MMISVSELIYKLLIFSCFQKCLVRCEANVNLWSAGWGRNRKKKTPWYLYAQYNLLAAEARFDQRGLLSLLREHIVNLEILDDDEDSVADSPPTAMIDATYCSPQQAWLKSRG
jgi:hypothetical protein